jgi:hypothetical protein
MSPNGFTPISKFKRKPRLMIGIEGLPDSGKTEFAMTAPPGIGILAVDRGYEHVVTKAEPPAARQDPERIFMKLFPVPQPGQSPGESTYLQIWKEFYANYLQSLQDVNFRTVVIDGDSDTWELQQLAAFGKVTQIPPIQRTDVNAARRVMIARGFDSGRNIIFTYRLKPEYEKIIKLNSRGEPQEVDEKTGNWRRTGFNDQDYLVQVQLRAIYNPKRTRKIKGEDVPVETVGDMFGVEILKCKPAPDLVGIRLWGAECNFTGLVQTIYPEADLKEWGLADR